MTDKQIIIDGNKFENAENEPINQEAVNKFIGQTDKFYIDGVDVSGCDFLAKKDDYCSYSGVTYTYKGQCMCSDEEMCKEHPKCFYKKVLKQLKRKEQEYEELRQYHNKCCEENAKKEAEWLEKFNQVSIDFYNGKYCNKENCNLLKAKEQECEELKKDYATAKSMYDLCQSDFMELAKIKDKYKQTLTEIKEIAEGQQSWNEWNSKHSETESEDDIFAYNCSALKQILQKINEVLNA